MTIARLIASSVESRSAAALELKRLQHSYDLISPFQAGKPTWSDWSFDNAVERGLKLDVLVFSAFRSRAQSLGSVAWTAEERQPTGWEPAPDHEILELIEEEPNRWTSRQEMVENYSYHLDLAGNGLLHKILLGGRKRPGAELPRIAEIRNLLPANIKPVPSGQAETLIDRYEFRVDGKAPRRFEPEEIVHGMYADPSNAHWGVSPLKAMSRVVDTHIKAVEWNMVAMDNRAVTDGVFSSEAAMTPQEYKRYKKMVWEQHAGADNARAPWVLGGGLSWQPMSRSFVEMDFVASSQMLRELVLSGADVTPVMAGFFDQATLANAEVSRKMQWVDKYVPWLWRLAGVYRRGVVPHFGDRKKLRVVPDLTDVEPLREDRAQQAEVFERLVKNGVPYNDAIEVSGLPIRPIPVVGDEPYGVTREEVRIALEKTLGPKRSYHALESKGGRRYLLPEAKVQAEAASGPIMRAARESERAIRSTVEASADEIRGAVSREALSRALAEKDLGGVQKALALDSLAELWGPVDRALEAAVRAGAGVGQSELSRQLGRSLEILDSMPGVALIPERQNLGALLAQTSAKGIEKAARSWFETGEDLPTKAVAGAEIAELFEWFVLLTDQQVNAALRFYRQLLGGNARAQALGKTKRLLQEMAADRAENIAGQEATLAVHQGQLAVWLQAVEQKEIERGVRTWINGGDGRVCPICLDLGGQTVDLNEPYYSNVLGSSVSGPGAPHNKCRCGELLTIEN